MPSLDVTVATLKEQVLAVVGTPIVQQRLIYGGKFYSEATPIRHAVIAILGIPPTVQGPPALTALLAIASPHFWPALHLEC